MKTILFSYLKQRMKIIGLFLLFAALYILVLALYALPMEAALYPLGLCLAIGLMVLIVLICVYNAIRAFS